MLVPTVKLLLGDVLLPPTPKTGDRALPQYQQSVAIWTRQAEQTFRQFERALVNLTTAQIPGASSLGGGSLGGGLYWSQGLFDAAFALKDTDDLAEGSLNLYFTIARARQSISAILPVVYSSLTGVISLPVIDGGHA